MTLRMLARANFRLRSDFSGVNSMTDQARRCPDCESPEGMFNRRDFLKTTGAAALAAGALPTLALGAEESKKKDAPESLVKVLYDSLKPEQKKEICFGWDYVDGERGLLRTRIS